jgi:glucose/arabinose dehydrogenase
MCLLQIVAFTLFAATELNFEPVHNQLKFNEPVQVLFGDGFLGDSPLGDNNKEDDMYVVEKSGVIYRVSLDEEAKHHQAILDIRDRVDVGHSEEGLLSLAFHPNYREKPEIFVWYTSHNPRRMVLSSFCAVDELEKINSKTEKIILEVEQPWGNHNGGTILFGPDGYLYLGIGDGGGSNDTKDNAQNTKSMLGKIIRIDIDKTSENKNYSIPDDNPFTKREGFLPEIWAYGLRNPWRMSFDNKTGKLWVADVGQNKWEEIDIVEKGGNYGWNLREGSHIFMKKEQIVSSIDPVYEYGRYRGGSVTGGFVYRGENIPELKGSYLFSDYLSGRTWALKQTNDNLRKYKTRRIIKNQQLFISSYGQDQRGELYVCGFESPYALEGKIYRLVLTSDNRSSSITDNIR